jgi:hypothetical protein
MVNNVFLLEVQFLCAHCDIDKECNHIPGKQWVLLLVNYTFCAHIPGFMLCVTLGCGTCINSNEAKGKHALEVKLYAQWTSAVDMSERTALSPQSRPLDWLQRHSGSCSEENYPNIPSTSVLT